jgi:hypothetical protein
MIASCHQAQVFPGGVNEMVESADRIEEASECLRSGEIDNCSEGSLRQPRDGGVHARLAT